ncbi:MAG: aminotransferase class V-fold PLP-dependent enzyme [Myxococcota bacterium]
MTPLALRDLFPALKSYTWLNAAASSPTPQPVLDAMTAHLRETAERGDLGYSKWAVFKDQVRARLARFIGASADEVAFTPSTSFGFHVIAQLLKARGVEEVLTLEAEFPSTTLPLLYDGLTLRGVRARPDGRFTVEDLEAALTPRTKALAVSVVQFASGFRVDLDGVSRLCRARGLTLCLNAAQGLGQAPVDVKRLGASFLAATSHKWLMAGYGVGVLYVAKEWLDAAPLPFGGWLSVEPQEQFDAWIHTQRADDAHGFTARGTKFRRQASALEAGGGAWVGLHGLDAALALHEALGVQNTLTHNIGLQLHLREGLRRRGFTPNTPDEPSSLSGICVVPVQGAPQDVVRALIKEAAVVTTARGGGVRISTHAYNTAEDVERLLSAFERLGVRPG